MRDYNARMSISPGRGKTLDIGLIGIERELLPPLADEPLRSRFDPRTFWPDARRALPLEIEIGSGKGTFLVQQAARRPDVNYLGIEYAKAFWRYAADRCRRHDLNNVRLLHEDAGEFIAWRTADGVVDQVHLYFPDPWPKARHHKRRLIQEDFLRHLHRVLAPEGVVRIVTDHDGYFEWIRDHAQRVADCFEPIPFERPGSGGDDEVVGTNFERKYRREGRPFNAVALKKS